MIAFSCNVPQTALTFGKYSTSGPIRLLAPFWEGTEAVEGGGQPGHMMSVCHVPRPQDLKTLENPYSRDPGTLTTYSTFTPEEQE